MLEHVKGDRLVLHLRVTNLRVEGKGREGKKRGGKERGGRERRGKGRLAVAADQMKNRVEVKRVNTILPCQDVLEYNKWKGWDKVIYSRASWEVEEAFMLMSIRISMSVCYLLHTV